MAIPFEATRSYVYKASRYELLPRIAEKARSFGDGAEVVSVWIIPKDEEIPRFVTAYPEGR